MPTNATMAGLRRCFEAAGFVDVKTVLSSGNVVFSAAAAAEADLARRARAALEKGLGHGFPVLLRTLDELATLLASDPYRSFRVPAGAKRVVTFLEKAPRAKPSLPVELDGARILCLRGREAFATYLPNPRGAVFMKLIEKTFGKEVTTRTWETVRRVAAQRGG
jgi:uncharacterized protein (DUF1697 family)